MLSIFNDKILYKNLVLALVTLVLLFVGWLKYLNYYTLHDNFIKVPNFNNIQIAKLDSIVEANNIRYVIIDSIFDRSKLKGILVNQDPEPQTNVKMILFQKRRDSFLIQQLFHMFHAQLV
jgi:hypothetical protein